MTHTTTFGLSALNDYLVVELPGGSYVLDTGAPVTFGKGGAIDFVDHTVPHPAELPGLTPSRISHTVGHAVDGLIGVDVLNNYDVLIDLPQGKVSFSSPPLILAGEGVPLNFFKGLPLLDARIDGVSYRLIFDTGAPVSYWHGNAISRFPAEDEFVDDLPGYGAFSTPTHRIPMHLERNEFNIRCGQMPLTAAAALTFTGAEGILGNEIMHERTVAYLARRSILMVEPDSWASNDKV